MNNLEIDYTDEGYQDDINHLASAQLEEFEQWLDEVNKYNDLIDFGDLSWYNRRMLQGLKRTKYNNIN